MKSSVPPSGGVRCFPVSKVPGAKGAARSSPAPGRRRRTGFPLLLAALFCAGCAVGPNYKRPRTDTPPSFRGEMTATADSLGDLPWWGIFRDDALQELIREALTNNYDLRIAVSRVEQARALAAQSRAAFFPQVNYTGLAGRGRQVGAGGEPSPSGSSGSLLAADANASWELDLWGRIRRLNEAARAQYLASQEARRDVHISLIGQVAQSYFQLLALDAQLEIARQATNAFGDTLRIFSERLSHGVASRLETASAEAALASAAAAIPDLERRIELQEDEINVLRGRYLGTVRRSRAELAAWSAPEVPAGLPSALLERRPDIREAEQLLRSANAQVGVSIADFFPRLNLTGLLGQVSPELSAFTAGAPNAWSIAANLTGPLFQGGRLAAQYRQAKALRAQYWLQYQAAVLNGFREVSDALISRQKFAEARIQQQQAVDAYQQAVKVSLERYRLGQSSYYEVLQEQQQLFPAENALVQAAVNQMIETVQLYRALGGGWETSRSENVNRKTKLSNGGATGN